MSSISGSLALERREDGPDDASESRGGDDAFTSAIPASEREEAVNIISLPEAVAFIPNVTEEGGSPDFEQKTMEARAYQKEMFYLSLQENIIVAMDTGTGKTQVAMLRIREEIERHGTEKLIWFLAPTVFLCVQQFGYLQKHLPRVKMRLITGNENLETWSDAVWNAVVESSQVVVSTPQVLYDALCHSYIEMSRMGLLVFDEAHRYTKNAPGSRLMQNFYHKRKQRGDTVPSILGMTASPSHSSVKDFEHLEQILDARCVAPTTHREELIKQVKKPQIIKVDFTYLDRPPTASIESLEKAYHDLDILQDPYLLQLKANPTRKNLDLIEKAIWTHRTFSQDQFSSLVRRSHEVHKQLGSWAADRYIKTCVSDALTKIDQSNSLFENWIFEEKKYLADALRRVSFRVNPDSPPSHGEISPKAELLIQELLTVKSPVGIIFATERSTVAMIYELLLATPEIRDMYNIGAVVGASNYNSKAGNIYEMSVQSDFSVMQSFRSGKTNLLIATDVLEEGIDVPACNLVICFDPMRSLRSFIQRRGRARMRDSKLMIFLEKNDEMWRQWEALEEEVKRQYEAEDRERKTLEDVELAGGTNTSLCLKAKTTSARIDFIDAKAHLEHFCKTLAKGDFVDARPDYIVHTFTDDLGTTLSATVYLPSSLPSHIRQAKSQYQWKSESDATKDAALQAYTQLYEAGLLNEHLLPFTSHDMDGGVQGRVPFMDTEGRYVPWPEVASLWKTSQMRWMNSFTLLDNTGKEVGIYDVVLPVELQQPCPIKFYIDSATVWTGVWGSGRHTSQEESEDTPDHTSTLLSFTFGHRWPVEHKHHVVRIAARDLELSVDQIGGRPCNSADDRLRAQEILVRNEVKTPYLVQELLPTKPDAALIKDVDEAYDTYPDDEPYLALKKLTKRSDFLHPVASETSQSILSSKRYSLVLPLSWATMDLFPARCAQFGMLIPSLIHELEVTLIVKHLNESILSSLNLTNLDLVREAISSRSSLEPSNYERLEFLGDSILKYCAAILAAVINPNWPEGYLSLWRDRLVSNGRLSQAAMTTGLAKYILLRAFTGVKWRPLYLEGIAKTRDAKDAQPRKVSTKTLADVVESLIGAAFQDGGLHKALQCISIFLPEQDWSRVLLGRNEIYSINRQLAIKDEVLRPLEDLLGYSFKNKAILVEATTHPSDTINAGQRSMDRFEFIGDAVLDNIIVTKLYAVEPPLKNYDMHTLKTAMVNADFLAFLSFEAGVTENQTVVVDGHTVKVRPLHTPLWQFLRHAAPQVAAEQEATAERHKELRNDILDTLNNGDIYPWALLARLRAKKMYSDFIEALIGAIFIDSGSLQPCEDFVARLGISRYLDRLLRDKVPCKHPKEMLGVYAHNRKVNYETQVMKGANGTLVYSCSIQVGARDICCIDDGTYKEEAMTRAATEAVRILQSEEEAEEGNE